MVERRSTSIRRERRQASAARRPPRDYLSAVRTHGDAHRRSSQASHTRTTEEGAQGKSFRHCRRNGNGKIDSRQIVLLIMIVIIYIERFFS